MVASSCPRTARSALRDVSAGILRPPRHRRGRLLALPDGPGVLKESVTLTDLIKLENLHLANRPRETCVRRPQPSASTASSSTGTAPISFLDATAEATSTSDERALQRQQDQIAFSALLKTATVIPEAVAERFPINATTALDDEHVPPPTPPSARSSPSTVTPISRISFQEAVREAAAVARAFAATEARMKASVASLLLTAEASSYAA